MKKLKVKEVLSAVEAIEILSSASEIDPTLSPKEEDFLHPSRWLDLSRLDENEELIRHAFSSVSLYLKELQTKDCALLEEDQTRQGIRAIYRIVEEAREKLDECAPLFQNRKSRGGISNLAEYKELQESLEIVFPEEFIREESLDRTRIDLGLHPRVFSSLSKEELEDLSAIRKDRKYEFFYLKKEDNKAFYSYDCIRRLKWIYDFNQVEDKIEKHLSKVRYLEAKNFQKRSLDILKETESLVNEFRQDTKNFKNNALASSLNKAIMALLCCSSSRNLPSQSTQDKNSAEYFSDFVRYLREAFKSREYHAGSHPKLSLLAHKFCFSFFVSVSLHKEIGSFLKKMMGEDKEGSSIDRTLLEKDVAFRKALEKWPNGPLHRTIRAFLRGEIEEGWDPFLQNNDPIHLFTLNTKERGIKVLKMPAPVQQTHVDKAWITEEFSSFLQGCLSQKKEKLLLIDLQDSTSVEENARVGAIRAFMKKEKIKGTVTILGLAKQTSFYFQKDEYKNEKKATHFLKQIKEQVVSGAGCGFFFPKEFSGKILDQFCTKAIEWVHHLFFDQKKELSCRERQDFIEIFYFLLTLKAIELVDPDYVAFVSKDGLDTAMSSSADLFFCVKDMLSPISLSQEDRDFFLWLLYGPILLLRERAIHEEDVVRVAHVVETFHKGSVKNPDLMKKGLKVLYAKFMLKSIEAEKDG